MNDPTIAPASFVQQGETTPVLISLLATEDAKYDQASRNTIITAKKCGEILLELKRRCQAGEVKAAMEKVGIARTQAWKFAKIAENWDKLNHPSSVNEAMRMLAEDPPEQPKPPPPKPPPPANPPLCSKCARIVRTSSNAPTKNCPECKKERSEWEKNRQPEAAKEEASEEEQADPAEGLTETSGPSKRKRRGKGGNPTVVAPPKPGAAVVTLRDIGVAVGKLMKMIDDKASASGLLGEAKPGQVRPVIETPELCGIRRQLEEWKKVVAKYFKSIAKE